MTTIAFATLVFLAPQPALCIEQGSVSTVEEQALRKKIGQLFIVGFPFKSYTPSLNSHLAKNPFGNFILFKRNIADPTQIRTLNSALFDYAKSNSLPAPLIAVDQEGGYVARVPTTPPMPSAQSLGQAKLEAATSVVGSATAKILNQSGFNLNLAPVLDLSSIDSVGLFQSRSFSADPNEVSNFGYQFGQASILSGILPTAKHFPGASGYTVDPHHSRAIYTKSLADLEKEELVPFKKFARLGRFSAIMMSHLSYTAFDKDGTPASLSKNTIAYLRNHLNFKGLVITDDFQMAGARSLLRPSELALKSLLAGADLVMITYAPKDQEAALNRVVSAVKSGELPMSEVDEKIRRLQFVKSYLKRPKEDAPSWTSPSLAAIDEKIVERHLASLSSAPLNSRNLCILDSRIRFSRRLNSVLKQTKGVELPSYRALASVSKNCSQVLYVIDSKASAEQLQKDTKAHRSVDFIALNLTSRPITKSTPRVKVISLFFNHGSAAKKIAELVDSSAIY